MRALIAVLLITIGNLSAAEFANGIPKDPNFFPLAVWVQNPKNAERFKAAGINTYVGLWKGPTDEQLADLKRAGMKIVPSQNSLGLKHKDDPAIIAWLQNDEPDNAQSLGEGKGWGPPVLPAKVIERHEAMRAGDPTRPILLNLGQGVAWDNWIGRGVRRNHPEDYAEYVKGGDIVSFDIYPATHDDAEIAGKLEFVAKGVERLKKWAGPDRLVWNCVEAKIGDGDKRMTPAQLRAEVWMSLIHGSRGIIYFVHQFKPVFREASIFEDADLLKAFTAVNKEIAELAPVLNSPDLPIKVTSSVAAMAKQRDGKLYIFAVAMNSSNATATFDLGSISPDSPIEVVGQNRSIPGKNGFSDEFRGYEAKLYRASLSVSK